MSEDTPPPKDPTAAGAKDGSFDPNQTRPMNGNGKNGRANVDNVVDIRRLVIEWRGAREVFAQLPPTAWISKDLQMGPGRPTLLVGYGSSAKTLAVQSLCLSVATGTPIWNKFPCARGVARHLDYEQGFIATARRYQRLARGMQLDPQETFERLFVSSFPGCFLNSRGAVDVYSKACDGASLVVLDAFRGAVPGADENDSGVREFVDVLTKVSEKTGATMVLLHHAGKPKDGHSDMRTVMRGSSAIFDGAGCVLFMVNQDKSEPRHVHQTKAPSEAESAAIDSFGLTVEDTLDEQGSKTGLRVVYSELADKKDEDADARYEREAGKLLQIVRENQGCTQTFVRERAGFRAQRVDVVLDLLIEEKRLVLLLGGSNGRTKTYRIGDGK